MTAMRTSIAGVALLATLSMTTAALAHQDSTACAAWDESDSMRCFECMQRVWTGHDWTIVNTCPRRSTGPYDVWGYAR
jgi:hypothetical protein